MTAPRIRSTEATREVDATEAAAVEASGALTTRTWRARPGPASQDPVNSDRLVPLNVHFVQRRPEATCEFERIALAPEVHEQQARRLVQHVAMQCRDLDAVGTQRAQDGVHFAGDQDEVA